MATTEKRVEEPPPSFTFPETKPLTQDELDIIRFNGESPAPDPADGTGEEHE